MVDMRYDLFLRYNLYMKASKDIVRTGWIRSGVEKGESIAEHLLHTSFNVLLLKRIIKDIEVNWDKALLMAMLHDLAEIQMGDIPTYEKSVSDKEREKSLLIQVFKDLGLDEEWVDELFQRNSCEALIVKVADLLSTVFQGLHYISEGICNRYIRGIVMNSVSDFTKISKQLESRDIILFSNFIRGYVEASIRKLCVD